MDLTKIALNLKKMLEKRGIKLTNDITISNHCFKLTYPPEVLECRHPSFKKNLTIFIHCGKKMGIHEVKTTLISKIGSLIDSDILLLTENTLSGQSLKLLMLFVQKSNSFLECWTFSELCTNKIEHSLIPKTRIIPWKERKNLLVSLKRNDYDKLMGISTNDFVTRYYSARIGEIFQFERTFGVQQPQIINRVVLDI